MRYNSKYFSLHYDSKYFECCSLQSKVGRMLVPTVEGWKIKKCMMCKEKKKSMQFV